MTVPIAACHRDAGWPKAEPFTEQPSRPPSGPAPAYAKDLCLFNVVNGVPAQADLNQAFRMVSTVRMIPHHDAPWIRALNRGGEWTIDKQGRYTPFAGRAPVDVYDLNFILETNRGRVVGLTRSDVLTLRRGDQTFRTVARFPGGGGPIATLTLGRVERLDLTLVGERQHLYRLSDDRLYPWAEATTLAHLGLTGPPRLFDLPNFRAVLFEGENGVLALRFDTGRWQRVGTLVRTRSPRRAEYVREVTEAPRSGAALVETDLRHLIVQITGGTQPAAVLVSVGQVDKSRDQSGVLVLATTSGEILRFSQPSPRQAPRWERYAGGAFRPIPGYSPAPRRKGSSRIGYPMQIASRGQFAMLTQDGIALYREGRFRLVPGSSVNVIGWLPRVEDLPAIGAVLVNSDRGLFELTPEGGLQPRPVGFVTGGLPGPLIINANHIGSAVVIAKDGLFSYGRNGVVSRIRGGEALTVGFGDQALGELPISDDVLLNAGNALRLVLNRSSPRWELCLAQPAVR